jgi:hypothetical protein
MDATSIASGVWTSAPRAASCSNVSTPPRTIERGSLNRSLCFLPKMPGKLISGSTTSREKEIRVSRAFSPGIFIQANLLEIAGKRAEALAEYRALQQELKNQQGTLEDPVADAVTRLSHNYSLGCSRGFCKLKHSDFLGALFALLICVRLGDLFFNVLLKIATQQVHWSPDRERNLMNAEEFCAMMHVAQNP